MSDDPRALTETEVRDALDDATDENAMWVVLDDGSVLIDGRIDIKKLTEALSRPSEPE